jgi:hypothetical protein
MRILSSLIVSGVLDIDTINNAAADTDKFLVADANGVVKFRTGAEVASDIGAENIDASTLKHIVKAGVALTRGQAVYVSGADGTNMIVLKSSNASESTSTKTLGLIAQDLALNGQGYVVTEGLLDGLNTSTATIGDPVWLGVDGNLLYGVANKPVAPAHMVFMGIVTRVQTNNGEIFVKVQNGFELEELHNVLITGTPVDKAVIQYDTASGLWKNSTLGGVTASTGTAGQVAYFTGGTTQAGSNNLFWDNANGRLGIGTTTPASSLHIASAANTSTGIQLNNAGSIGYLFGDGAGIFLRAGNTIGAGISSINLSFQSLNGGLGSMLIRLDSITNTPNYTFNADSDTGVGRGGANILTFYAGGERARFHATGNFSIGATTDSGQRLQVTGDTLITGALRVTGGITTGGASSITGIFSSGTLNQEILTIRSSALPATTNITDITLTNGQGDVAITTGSRNLLSINRGFNPTSGTGVYNLALLSGTINQTGGANGITRGLYVNPILTSAPDWRSIEWSNNTGWGLYGAGTSRNYLNGNLAVGFTGYPWQSATKAIDLGTVGGLSTDNNYVALSNNWYWSGTTNTYKVSDFATQYVQQDGKHIWSSAASGTAGNAITFTQAMTLTALNNLLIGSTSDSGQKLQVTGDTLLKGSGNTFATTALTVQNSDGTNLLKARNDGAIFIGSRTSEENYIAGYTSTSPFGAGQRTLAFVWGTGSGSRPNPAFYFTSSNNINYTSSSGDFIQTSFTFNPTSGTGAINTYLIQPTINQTGGANGITRGLYVNPTLTAAANWRSIEWSNNTGWGLYGAGTARNYLGGNLGINVAPSAWAGGINALQIGNTAFRGSSTSGGFSNNAYYDGTDWRYLLSTFATDHLQNAGSHTWRYAPSGTAGGVITWQNFMTLNTSGNLGIGSSNSNISSLYITKDITGATISYGITNEGTVQPSVTSFGINYQSTSNIAASVTLSNYVHYNVNHSILGAGSTVTNVFGFRVNSTNTIATNNYGFYGDIAAATGRWNLYMNGTAANYINGNTLIGSTTDNGLKLQVNGTGYFSGSVGIGTTALTGVNLYINKNITGATGSQSVLQSGVVQSDVTSIAWGFYNQARTQATAFTLGTYYDYFGQQAALGAGSSITNQYGFAVDSTLTGATNNYGFYGNIAAATNRWNLYMNGTANNYMAGNLGIGITSPPQPLSVQGTILTRNRLQISNGRLYEFIGTSTNLDITDSSSVITMMRFFSNGNVAINSTTDSGEKLQVNGTAKITGASSFGDTLSVNGSGSFVYAATCTATAKVGSATAGGSFMVLTPSVNSGFNSGFAVDGVYNAGKSEINLSAFGAKSGGPYSADMVFKTSSTTTLSEKMRLDSSGNLGVAATPSAWSAVNTTALQVRTASLWSVNSRTYLGANYYYDTAGNKIYINSTFASEYAQINGQHQWSIAVSGTSGGTVSFIQAMTLTTAGRLLLGSTSDSGELLQVTGTAKITGDFIAKSNLYTGASEALVTSTGVLSNSEVIQIYNGVAASTNIDKMADLILANNTSFTDGTIGRIIGVNGNLTSADKRIAQISMYLDGATNSGGIGFSTMSSGTFSTKMTLSSSGNLTVDTNTLFVDAAANSVAVGTVTINASAKLQIDSTTQGFLPPRMTAAQRTAISTPPEGLIVFQSDGVVGLYLYVNSAWKSLAIVN